MLAINLQHLGKDLSRRLMILLRQRSAGFRDSSVELFGATRVVFSAPVPESNS